MSILGIALGVTVLITVLSVLNGFDREIKKSIFSIITPITVISLDGSINHWQDVEKIIQKAPGVTAVSPFITGQTLLNDSHSTQPAIITGILPSKEKGVTAIADKMVEGRLSDLTAKKFGIVLDQELAHRLDVKLGDALTVIIPKKSSSSMNINPSFNRFVVTGIFQASGGFSAKLAFINLYDAQKIFGLNSAVTALHANITHLYAAPDISQQLENELPPQFRVTNWTEQLGAYFENIKLTKSIMFFIFILIIIVAIFNLVGTLIMIVSHKQSDIAILRTMGATPKTIMAIFVVQGGMIGGVGTLLGVLGGIALALNVTTLVDAIQHIFHIQLISSNLYFVNYLPSEVHWSDVWQISLTSLGLSLLATLRPAWNAARTDPADVLRYE
jgi:lipoprotein-releasing system permease protein